MKTTHNHAASYGNEHFNCHVYLVLILLEICVYLLNKYLCSPPCLISLSYNKIRINLIVYSLEVTGHQGKESTSPEDYVSSPGKGLVHFFLHAV